MTVRIAGYPRIRSRRRMEADPPLPVGVRLVPRRLPSASHLIGYARSVADEVMRRLSHGLPGVRLVPRRLQLPFPIHAIRGSFPGELAAALLALIFSGTLPLLFTHAAAPVLDHLFPIALPTGTTNTITAIGKFEPWPPAIWTDHPGIVFRPSTNTGSFQLELGSDVPPGPHLVRAHNPDGAGVPRFVIVTSEPQSAETEPNDSFAHAQPITSLPAHINGRLEKSGDVDSYAVTIAAGRTLVASVEAHVLQSPIDAALRIVNARGVEVAFNHDGGRTLDPFLAWTAPAAGTYIVQVFGFEHPGNSDIHFAGNPRCVYRLHLTDGPWLSHTLPLGAQRGVTQSLRAVGWNLPTNAVPTVEFPPASDPDSPGIVRVHGAVNELAIPLGDGPELLEAEPNDSPALAQPLAIPGAVTGRFENGADVDRYAIEVTPGGPLEIAIQAAGFGFPVDARLRIEDAAGAVVTKADESVPGDPSLVWTPTSAGRFFVIVDSLVHRGGERYLYRLSVRPGRAGYSATLSDSALVLEIGKTNEFKVAITRRHGFTNVLAVKLATLPTGVTSAPIEVPSTAAEAVIRLSAATNAATFSGPLRVLLTGSGSEQTASFPLISAGENNGVPQGYKHLVIESVDHLWLTVKAGTNAPPAK